jgi:hypothetical protein
MGHDKLFQKRNVLARPEKTRKLRRILIVCEGTKTEPNYFRKFKATNPEVFDAIDVQGTGYNTVSLITEAINIKNEAIQKKEPYIETWCVFDKDDFPIESFEKAIKMAEQNQIKCAYSIEAFEIWYMLHFNFYETAFSRLQYKEKLSELMKKTYLKNDPGMYLLLSKKQSRAIQNARKLYNKKYLLPLKDQNPITTVFQLVERLID